MKKSQKKKTKREKLFIEIYPIFKRSISDDDKELIQFLLENSNLPGRRANIELAQAFGDCIAKSEINSHNLIKKLLVYSQKIAPTNNPKEFLPFCGYFGVGAMTLNNSIFFDQSISLFRIGSKDSRWRIRESIAHGANYFIEQIPIKAFKSFESWIDQGNPLEIRGALSALTQLKILSKQKYSIWLLNLIDKVITMIVKDEIESSLENFLVLEKGLYFIISVPVSFCPIKGFEY